MQIHTLLITRKVTVWINLHCNSAYHMQIHVYGQEAPRVRERERCVIMAVCACVRLVRHASHESICTHSFYGEERLLVARLRASAVPRHTLRNTHCLCVHLWSPVTPREHLLSHLQRLQYPRQRNTTARHCRQHLQTHGFDPQFRESLVISSAVTNHSPPRPLLSVMSVEASWRGTITFLAATCGHDD